MHIIKEAEMYVIVELFENYVQWWSYIVDNLQLIVYSVCIKKVYE